MQKIINTITVLAAFAFVAGCSGSGGEKPKEVSQLEQNQAAKHFNDSNMEIFLRNYAAAEKSLTMATKLNPNVIDYWTKLADVQILLSNYAAAEKTFVTLTKLNSKIDDYWVRLGEMRFRLGNKSGATEAYKGALASCEAQLKLTPENPGYIDRKLRALILLGREKEARDVLAQAAKEFPGNATIQQLHRLSAVDLFLNNPQVRDFIVK